jgi:glycosyltransferase involved in cell wall biosynthesis
MTSSALSISVAICTYNRERYLPQLFASIKKQSLDKRRMEVILVNNNSPGNAEELFLQFSQENPEVACVYVLETQQGLSFARNRAIQKANYPLLTFLDDDAFIREDYLEVCVQSFEEYPKQVALGGKILLHYESVVPEWGNKYLNSLLGYFNLGDKALVFTQNNYPRGSNMTFRTALFEKVGGFHTGLGRTDKSMIGGEEKELFDRIYQHQLLVRYEPEAVVYHCVPLERTTREFIRRQAIGAGMSERVRTKTAKGFNYVARVFRELLLWGASLLLWTYFLLRLEPVKGAMIVRFRWWCSQGLTGWKKE